MNRFQQRRQTALRRIAAIEPFVEGTLARIPHPNCRHVAHRLTFKVKGKTKAVYVPVDLVENVIQWTKNYRQLKKLIRKVTANSPAILHRYVRDKAAAKRSLRLKSRS